MKCDGLSHIYSLDLFLELKLLREVLHRENSSPSETLDYIEKVDSFPNASIAYRILLTILVTVASAERIISKLKLIKPYLRSTMSQEQLTGLPMLFIEKNIYIGWAQIQWSNQYFCASEGKKNKFWINIIC